MKDDKNRKKEDGKNNYRKGGDSLNKLRVLNVMDHMGLGGAQTIVKKLVCENHNHYLLVLREADNAIRFPISKRVKVKVLKSRFSFSLSLVWELKRLVEKNKIDVIHAHLAKSILVVYLYKLFFGSKVKFVISEHGAVLSSKRWFYRFLLRRSSRYVTAFIGVSKKACDALVNVAKLKKSKVKLLYNYIDFDEIKFLDSKSKLELRRSLGLRKNDFVVGFVGRLSGVKNIDTIIDGFSRFEAKRSKLIIVGDGELRRELWDLKKTSLRSDDILFLGYRNDVSKLYQIFDVIVLASTTEASPMAFYESQVYGVPFVGSKVYAIDEFIKDGKNGLLFKLKDASSLADRLNMLYDNVSFRKKIAKESTRGLGKYDFKLYMKKLNEVYAR